MCMPTAENLVRLQIKGNEKINDALSNTSLISLLKLVESCCVRKTSSSN